MNNVAKNRWQVRVAAMIIFVLGFAAGVLALNVYRRVAGADRPPRDRFEQMARRLNLSDDQKTKVQQILGDTREQVRALRRESEPKFEEIRHQAGRSTAVLELVVHHPGHGGVDLVPRGLVDGICGSER